MTAAAPNEGDIQARSDFPAILHSTPSKIGGGAQLRDPCNEEHSSWTLQDDLKYWQENEIERPDDGQCREVANLIDYYFSNLGLQRNAILLRKVQRGENGYVDIKSIATYSRLRQYVAGKYDVLRSAIVRCSEQVTVSSSGLRCRRKEPLPVSLNTSKSSTIIAIDLDQNCDFYKVSDLFGVFGKMLAVTVVKEGQTVPLKLRKHMKAVPALGKRNCAVIEYQYADDALSAVRLLQRSKNQSSVAVDGQDQRQPLSEHGQDFQSRAIQDLLSMKGMRVSLLVTGKTFEKSLYDDKPLAANDETVNDFTRFHCQAITLLKNTNEVHQRLVEHYDRIFESIYASSNTSAAHAVE